MASSRILSAWFKKDGEEEKEIFLSDLTDEEYRKTYHGYLFCPNYKCNAQIVFASGETLKYFRTYPVRTKSGEKVKQHIDGCDYSVEHDLEERMRRRNDPDKKIVVSDDHMLKVLKRAHDRLVNPEKAKKKQEVSENTKKRASSKSKIDPSLSPSGSAGLAVDGAVNTEGREPSIYRKSVNDLSEKDYYYVRCVDGYIQDIVFGREYTYINLKTNNGKKARVLFSDAFAVSLPGINMAVYKEYIDLCRKKDGQIPLTCVGNVTKDDFEISIVIDTFASLMINGNRYYGIVNELNTMV